MSACGPHQNRSYLYGDGLFETVRVEAGKPRFLDYHRRRFEGSARSLDYPQASIDAGLEALNKLWNRRDGLWRVTVPRPEPDALEGAGPLMTMGYREFPYGNMRPPRIKIIEDFYFPEYTLGEHKTTSWLRSLQARRMAKQAGFDEALMVSPRGRLGEAAAANIFLLIDGQWVTPPVEGILPGVVRQALLDGAGHSGLHIDERPLFVADLARCEALVLTSTGRLVTAASCVDTIELATLPAKELKAILS